MVVLSEFGYAGYIAIEPERDRRNSTGILAGLTASREYLRSIGF
jgi:inosose dehydratase